MTTRRSETPNTPMDDLAAKMLDLVPDGVKAVVLLHGELIDGGVHHGTAAHTGYPDGLDGDAEVMADVLIHAKHIAEANGKDLSVVAL